MDLLASTDIPPRKRGSRLRRPHVVTERKEEGKYGVKTRVTTRLRVANTFAPCYKYLNYIWKEAFRFSEINSHFLQ